MNATSSRRYGYVAPVTKAFDLIEVLDALAREKATTIPRLALSWLLHQNGISTVIIGAKKMGQLDDNLAAVDVEWNAADLELRRFERSY